MPRVMILICLINIVYTISLATKVVRRDLQIAPENTIKQTEDPNTESEKELEPHIIQISTQSNSTASTGNTSGVIKDLKLNNVISNSNNITSTSEKDFSLQNNIVIASRKPTVDSEALLRGFYVFIGLSVVILLYVMYRSYRIRLGGNRPTTVRKYGILTQRTDMEMLPLPLDDDDEDDTVFDVGNHTNR